MANTLKKLLYNQLVAKFFITCFLLEMPKEAGRLPKGNINLLSYIKLR